MEFSIRVVVIAVVVLIVVLILIAMFSGWMGGARGSFDAVVGWVRDITGAKAPTP